MYKEQQSIYVIIKNLKDTLSYRVRGGGLTKKIKRHLVCACIHVTLTCMSV